MKMRKNCILGIIFELPYIAGFFPQLQPDSYPLDRNPDRFGWTAAIRLELDWNPSFFLQ